MSIKGVKVIFTDEQQHIKASEARQRNVQREDKEVDWSENPHQASSNETVAQMLRAVLFPLSKPLYPMGGEPECPNSIAAHSIETLCALGITVLSFVMLTGVFPKVSAYLGIATFPLAVLGEALQPLLGGHHIFGGYQWWWAFFLVWLLVVGWTLFRLGTLSGSLLGPSSTGKQGARP